MAQKRWFGRHGIWSAKRFVADREDDWIVESTWLDFPIGLISSWTHRSAAPLTTIPVEISGELPRIELLVTTSAFGSLIFSDGRFRHIGNARWSYGAVRHHDRWFVFEQTGQRGRLVEFDCFARNTPRIALWGLPARIHQIGTTSERLLLTDSYNNRILSWRTDGSSTSAFWRRRVDQYFPAGPALRGRPSGNYAHFNSVTNCESTTFVIAHNDYERSGKLSELWVLDREMKVLDRRSLGFANCHNFFTDGANELFLASHDGHVVLNGSPVCTPGYYLRGLSVSDDFIVIGGSDRLDRIHRGHGVGRLVILTRHFEWVAEITLRSTQIHEIRRIDRADFT